MRCLYFCSVFSHLSHSKTCLFVGRAVVYMYVHTIHCWWWWQTQLRARAWQYFSNICAIINQNKRLHLAQILGSQYILICSQGLAMPHFFGFVLFEKSKLSFYRVGAVRWILTGYNRLIEILQFSFSESITFWKHWKYKVNW